MSNIKKQLQRILTSSNTGAATVFELVIASLVLFLCAAFVIETFPISEETNTFLLNAEVVITALFAIEYLLRWWVHDFSWRYPFRPFAIIDLLAILPLFVTSAHWQFIRLLRLFRILRLLRFLTERGALSAYISDLHLRYIRIFFTLFCLIFISSGVIYDAERSVNATYFRHFFDALYFTTVTMTTVGFGDIVPISDLGRALTMLMIYSGVVLIPWQIANLAQALVLSANKRAVTCVHCGLKYHDPDAAHCKACGNVIYQEYDGS